MSWFWPASPGAARGAPSSRSATGERRIARFGPFQLDTVTEEMWNSGHRIRLQSQPFRILVLLLSNPNELVTREDIRRALWSEETSVGFGNSINASMNKLRAALEDSAQTPRYIETLARRGYRLMVPVEWSEKNAPEDPQARKGSWLGRLFREGSVGAWQLILATLVLALLAAILFSNVSHSS